MSHGEGGGEHVPLQVMTGGENTFFGWGGKSLKISLSHRNSHLTTVLPSLGL